MIMNTKPFDIGKMTGKNLNDEKHKRQMWNEFFENMLWHNEDADSGILEFIFNIQINSGIGAGSEAIRKLFYEDYSYYFAVILKEAFPGGYVAWVKPFNHICYVYKNIGYNIRGVIDEEMLMFQEYELVPIQELKYGLESFMHRGYDEIIEEEMGEFANEKGISYAELCSKIYECIPDDLKIQPKNMFFDAKRFFKAYKYQI